MGRASNRKWTSRAKRYAQAEKSPHQKDKAAQLRQLFGAERKFQVALRRLTP